MKTMLIASVIALSVVGLAQAASEASPAQKELAKYLVQSEKQVKDAVWMNQQNLYIGVITNGSDRSGFAQYICAAAADHQIKPKMVKVVDVVKVQRTGKFEELGRAYCP
jgi:hypothetical protein